FFSSRRRHTRSYGDWSSDVCSSDLGFLFRAAPTFQLPLSLERRLRVAIFLVIHQPPCSVFRAETVRVFLCAVFDYSADQEVCEADVKSMSGCALQHVDEVAAVEHGWGL